MANPIRETSLLYNDLCNAYENENLRQRFKKCYTLADKASYDEVHYVISMLKEAGWSEEVQNISIARVVDLMSIINFFKILLASNEIRRRAFLMDILEEARDRKKAGMGIE